MGFPCLVFLFVGMVAFAVAITAWQARTADNILTQWAEDHGYELLDSERRWVRLGPFFWTTSKGQFVYYVTVRTPEGHLRRGWVRCGGWFLGVLQNRAEVRWGE